MPPSDFKDGLIAATPHLRAFAISLTNDVDRADDLVQDTLLRALQAREQFVDGTNLRAWLFTILRNSFYSSFRKRRREVEDPDGVLTARLESPASQLVSCEVSECLAALAKLPPEQREALLLVTTQGLDYEEAARVCGCREGTIKSRVNRARAGLAQLMHCDRYTREALEAPRRRKQAAARPFGKAATVVSGDERPAAP